MKTPASLCLAGISVAALMVAALAGGCAKSESKSGAAPAAAEALPPAPSQTESWTAEQLAFIAGKFGKLESTPSGLRYKILTPGEGEATPAPANLVVVNYRGSFLDGRVFDDSWKRGEPGRFRIGVKQVIKGWDETVVTMKRGERRLVVIPFWLGYGVAGKIPYIPPRAPLVFEIELLSWESTKGIPKSQNP